MSELFNDQPVYVILGATGALGFELCQQLSRQGAKLLLAGRSPDKLQAAATHLQSPYEIIDACQADDIERAVVKAKELYGYISGVANCVGSLILKPAHLVAPQDFLKHLAINLHSAFYAVQSAVRHMDKQRGGSIVLVSSVAARFGLANHEVIATSKAGIMGLVRSAAATYAPSNIRVNAVAPGLIDTPLTQFITQHAAIAKASIAMHPLGRLGQPADVARIMGILLAPENHFITGEIWGIDGGLANAKASLLNKP